MRLFKKATAVALASCMAFSLTACGGGAEETTAAATEAATEATEATQATEPTTAAAGGLTVNATSNYFPAYSVNLSDDEEYVTVTYFIESEKNILNVQWEMYYDPNVLQFENAVNVNEEVGE